MINASTRPVPEEKHPLCQQRYIIPTPSIEDFYAQVKRCIRFKIPGAMTFAFPRYGKTRGIMYCIGALQADFKRMPVYEMLCPKKGISSESSFFSDLLRAVHHEKPNVGNNSAKRGRLYDYLIQKGDYSDYKSVVIFFDEAQKLSINEYEWLRDIHDALDEGGIRLLTFLVGQQQLLHQKQAFREEKQIQIIQRFMIDELKFKGIQTLDEMATCLHNYDEAFYPADSDWSFTRFFFKKAYDNGYRMFDAAELLWDVFRAAHDETSPASQIDIPMTYFTRAVEYIFIEHQVNDAESFKVDEEICVQAVNLSSFTQSQVELELMSLMGE